MGINGLLKFLSPLLIPENVQGTTDNSSSKRQSSTSSTSSSTTARHNIRQFKNKTVAIDASSWLYKASYSTAPRLVEAIESNRIDPVCEKAVCKYMIKRCEELLTHAEVKRIYLVFDGKRCPMKAVTNQERESKRKANLSEARRLNELGMKDQAMDKYRACVKVTPWMADSVAKEVAQRWKKNGGFIDPRPKVECVFSPYEADAQLAKLCIDGLADAVITEDSDVLVYSAACNVSFPIIYKLDRDRGYCDVISMDWLLSPGSTSKSASSRELDDLRMGYSSLRRLLPTQMIDANGKTTGGKGMKAKKPAGAALLSHLVAMVSREARKQGSGARMFVQACVLAGCDYAPSQLSGVGLVTAFKTIKDNAHRDPQSRFLNALKSFPADKVLSSDDPVPGAGTDAASLANEYEELLAKSECVFYFHRVLDRSGNIVPLVSQRNDMEIKEENPVEDFIPSTDRFQDDSFIGSLDANKKDQATEPVRHMNSDQATVQNTYFSSDRTITQNPYQKKPSAVQTTTSPTAKKGNMFSFYAHKSTGATPSQMAPKKISQGTMRKSNIPSSEPVTLDSSDDEIDDVLEPIAGMSRKKPMLQRLSPSTSSLLTSSLAKADNCETRKPAPRSSHFFSQDSIRSRENKISSFGSSGSEVVRIVTPTSTDMDDKLECSKHCLDSSSEDELPAQNISSSASNTRRHTKQVLHNESSDDEDCIIIEEPNSGSKRSASSQPPFYPTRSGRFSSTFANAQNEGTRARFSSPALASKKRKSVSKQISKALGSSTKTARNASIKGFFAPITKRKL